MGNVDFIVTTQHICENMIADPDFDEIYNNDPSEAYRFISDNYGDSVLNFSAGEKVIGVEVTRNAVVTVALPVYDSANIVWLAMESLCRQQGISFKWELIVCEEQLLNFAGRKFFDQYYNRLSEVGCQTIKYIPLAEWIPLSAKWKLMAQHADIKSEVFVLQASDCYSQPLRLARAFSALTKDGYNWYQSIRGFFYHIKKGSMILYDHSSLGNNTLYKTALNMAILTKYARILPDSEKKKGIDGWMFRTIPEPKVFNDVHSSWKLGIDTHGANHISERRERFFINTSPPFVRANSHVSKSVPKDVYEMLLKMR